MRKIKRLGPFRDSKKSGRALVLPLLLGSAVLLAGCAAEQRPAPQQPAFYASLATPHAQVDQASAAGLINSYRENNGLSPLVMDSALQARAGDEAQAMARAGSPASADALKARLRAQGLAVRGVNVSAGYHTMAEAFSGWRDSPGHNKTMLAPDGRLFGVATAYAPASKYKVYWVLVVAE